MELQRLDDAECASIEIDLNRRIELLLRVGQLLMDSSADTARVLRNMHRTAAYLGLPEDKVNIYVGFEMLMVNFAGERTSFTRYRQCLKHGVDFAKISAVSKLSWRAIKEDMSLDQFSAELDRIEHAKPNYTHWQVAILGGFACGGFCIQFGCDWTAFFYCSLAAILGFRLRMYLNGKGFNSYMNIGVAALVSTIIAWLTTFLSLKPGIARALPSFMVSETPWHPLMACALYIVPGVPIINFVHDMINGYITVGITRGVRVLLFIAAMSFGIVGAIAICGIDNFVTDLSMTPHNSYISYAIAAAISAIGFSTIFNTPHRLLWAVAVGGIIAVCTRNFVNLGPSSGNIGFDEGLIAGSLVGSALVSIIACKAIHVLHTPHQCLSIPSVIPMIPGVLMYRALFALIDMHGVIGEVTVAVNNGIRASLVILVIALGVAIPNIFFRKLIAPKRNKKLINLLLARREMDGKECNVAHMV